MRHGVAGLTVELLNSTDTKATAIVMEEENLDNLYPALVQCFGIIFLGFLAGKCSIISNVESRGLSKFVGSFSLPALIFVSLCQLDFSSVNWLFLGSIALAKSIVFILVLFVSLFVHRPLNLSRSGLYAIFCTQSNDFALGYPVLSAIYGSSHPEYPMYLYLLAPVSLAMLNPIGLILMEIGKSSNEEGANRDAKTIAKKVILGIIKNPLITMTFLGILGNLIFHGSMPNMIFKFMDTLGSAFTSSALFMLGLRMVGPDKSVATGVTSFLTPFILVTMKSLVLPIIAREVVSQVGAGKDANETLDLSNYAFLYGTIPTAPSVFVFASNYDVVPDMIATTITASTFIAAPLMFITAKLLTLMNMNPEDYVQELDTFLLDVSVIGLIAAAWVVVVLIISGKARRLPHSLTLVLALSQVMACCGAVMWTLLDCSHGWSLYLQFILFGMGVFSSRVTAAMLAVTILLLQTKPLCSVVRYRPYLVGISIGLPALLVASLTIVVGTQSANYKDDPNFQYGTTQAVVAMVVLVVSLITTIICMILAQRYQKTNILTTTSSTRLSASETDALLSNVENDTNCSAERNVEIEDLVEGVSNGDGCGGRYRCDSTHRDYCSGLIRRYEIPPAEDALSSDNVLGQPEEDDDQLVHHNLLLLLLCVSMFVGAALCIWTLVMDGFSGIYLELVFMDGFLNLGQGIFTFALFGFNAKGIARKVKQYLRKCLYGKDQIILPPWEDLDQTTRAVSTMFIKHHLAVCVEQVVHDIPGVLGPREVVRGKELVDWLLERGLVHSRQDGEIFSRHLLRGRVIRHVESHLDFYDDLTVYTFSRGPD